MTGLDALRVLPVLLLLAACGEIPQPFRHDGINHAALPRVARGVVVRPLDDGPRGAALAEAIVRRLVEGEVPASTREVVPGALIVAGTARPEGERVAIDWVLLRPDGEVLGGFAQEMPAVAWTRATPRTMSLIADEMAGRLTPLLHGENDAAAAIAAAPAATVRLVPLSGLPGDGDQALTQAMRRQLRRAGLAPADDAADFVVRAEVGLTAGPPGEDILALTWIVADRDGRELGKAAQQGAVPRGRLSGAWAELAGDVAMGGVEGVAEVIRAAQGRSQ